MWLTTQQNCIAIKQVSSGNLQVVLNFNRFFIYSIEDWIFAIRRDCARKILSKLGYFALKIFSMKKKTLSTSHSTEGLKLFIM